MRKIVAKEVLAPGIKKFVIEHPQIARKRQPGQFVIVRVHPEGERFPLTIADADPERGTITLVVQEIGHSTLELGRKEPGDFLMDVVGPLGRPTPIRHYGRVVCMGGGVGVAEIYPVARALKEAGNEVVGIIGARTRELVIMEAEMRSATHQLIVCTDDGSYGVHGLVTRPLQEMIDRAERIDHVFCIGPVPMMKAVAEVTRRPGIPTSVSLNPIMVDGTGMCGACRVTVGGVTRFACVDGPDFDAHEVDFDELMKRLAQYRVEEQMSLEMLRRRIEEAGLARAAS
ncbi:MAG: sulfide/dihydroorotate dehydrogenase-like FAD/NAD-binding protein [candidate division KSB1 bacterium]|nr:sulfide/dihydroorotate dehydrogenase-like FAD/NAD-binding protein [candidate division KSB1 bacterium]